MRTRTALFAITALSATLVACGTDTPGDSGSTRSSTTAEAGSSGPATDAKPRPVRGADGTYEQTWKRDSADTTCDQYQQQMTPTERWVMAAGLLAGERGEGAAEAGKADVTRFEADLGVACHTAVADSVMTEVGATLYKLDPSYAP
ncbi:hypothetical protein JNUCC64_01190 [Streptomyces sp. JNUCC 64]